MEWSGPAIRPGLDNRHLIIEGHIEVLEGDKRSWKVKEGHGWSFPITRLTFQVRKVIGGGCVACRIIVSAPVPVPFLWTLNLGRVFGTCIWDLDLGLGFGIGIGLDKK